MRTYFDRYLARGNKFPEHTLEELAALLEQTAKTVYEIFGETAFYLYRKRNDKWSWFKRPTTVVDDPLMFVVSQRLPQKETLIAKSHAMKIGLKEL